MPKRQLPQLPTTKIPVIIQNQQDSQINVKNKPRKLPSIPQNKTHIPNMVSMFSDHKMCCVEHIENVHMKNFYGNMVVNITNNY